ncbi:MAG: DHA2 family efflux MFS transporter permease subunit [Rhodospirillaceae bacterium]|nr:MAG: DHA2 family efflux MFS transporter permease subunit [Rhodospirillaceae bacterium]
MSDGAGARAELPPLRGAALLGMGLLLGGANFLAAFDISIANVSIPSIASGLAVSPREGTWVITSYMVAEALSVPLTGWLATRFGPGRTLAVAMAGFTIASALCGLSTSMAMLVTFRALQGLAGGPMMPLSQSMLVSIFPKERASTAMGIWAMTTVIGPILGPLVGGQICDRWSWPWIFLINVPVAAIFAAFIWGALKHRDPLPVRRPIDVIGLGLMVIWVVAIQAVLDRGQELDWFGSTYIVGLTIVAVVGFIAFLIWELTDEHPIVNLRVFRSRGYTLCLVVVCISFGTYLGSVIISPLWLQTNMGYTASWAGITSAPSGVVTFCLAPLVAWLSTRMDARLLISGGLLAFASIMFWRAHFASNVSFELIMTYMLMNGGCIAFFFAPAMSMALGFLKPQEIADGAGMMAFTRSIALAFATAMAAAYWQDSTIRDRAVIIDRLHGTGVLGQLGDMGFAPDQALQYLDNMVQDQAVMFATNDAFLAFAAAVTIGAFCIWLVPRKRLRNTPVAH